MVFLSVMWNYPGSFRELAMPQHPCTKSSNNEHINKHKLTANQEAQTHRKLISSSPHVLKQIKHKANPAGQAHSKSKRSIKQRNQGTSNPAGQAHSK